VTVEVAVLDGGRRIRLAGPGGEARMLSARWLYDHAEAARDPASGQRRHGALELEDAIVLAAKIVRDRIELEFPAGRRSLPLARLDDLGTARPSLDLWTSPEAIAERPPVPFAAYLAEDAALAEALARLARTGLVLLSGAGDDPGGVEKAVARFGFIRETNYGRVFDVRVEAEPGNFAFTERALDLHTDNPYRDPVPTLQALHAIRADAAGGGATAFVDGFAHAEALRREAPGAFDILAREPVRFTFREASGARWSARFPVLETDAEGGLNALRVNHRSLDLEPLEAARQNAWYDAYLDLYRRLHAPEAAFERRLRTGELVLFDNRRILHGRRAHDHGGARWLRGGYADVDGVYATLARLGG
jgi:gamma-butyrobetaine dioxygenase